MSYFSDKSIEIMERNIERESMHPPAMQLILEDSVSKYLELGGDIKDVNLVLNDQFGFVSEQDKELVYSFESLDSLTLLLRCIRVAWLKLSKLNGTDENILFTSIMHEVLPTKLSA